MQAGDRVTEIFRHCVELTENWREYRLRFGDMEQVPGWGNPRPGAIELTAVHGILFELAGIAGELDVWIDDVGFFADSLR